jgi:membrane protein
MGDKQQEVKQSQNKKTPNLFSKAWWKRLGYLLVQVAKNFTQDSAPQWAAAIAYYTLLSIFPLLLAAASIASYFVDPEWAITQLTEAVGDFVPQGEEQIENIVQQAMDARGTVGVLSIATLLWSGSRVFSSVTVSLNIIYDVDESYGFFKRTAIDILMLLTIGVLFILGLASRYFLNLFLGSGGLLPDNGNLLYNLGFQIVPVGLLLVAFFLTYLYVPRRRVEWKAAAVGAVVATTLFVIVRPIFFEYVQRFGEFSIIYGSIAIIIILVIWAWIGGMILLFGGELVSHIQQMFIEGLSRHEVSRRHKRRSPASSGQNYEAFRQEVEKEILDRQERDRQLRAYEARNKASEQKAPLGGLALVFTMLGAFFMWIFVGKR